MALSLGARAERRAALNLSAIESALAEGASQKAFNLALKSLQSELAKVRRRRPAAGALTGAELAGSIAAIAARLHAHSPPKPAGCPREPRAEHLLAVFAASYAAAEGEDR